MPRGPKGLSFGVRAAVRVHGRQYLVWPLNRFKCSSSMSTTLGEWMETALRFCSDLAVVCHPLHAHCLYHMSCPNTRHPDVWTNIMGNWDGGVQAASAGSALSERITL